MEGRSFYCWRPRAIVKRGLASVIDATIENPLRRGYNVVQSEVYGMLKFLQFKIGGFFDGSDEVRLWIYKPAPNTKSFP